VERVEGDFDWSALEELARRADAKIVFARARCEHGKTRDEYCSACDGGYVQDTHYFFYPRSEIARANGRQCAAVSDDGYDAAYIPARFEPRIRQLISVMNPEARLRIFGEEDDSVADLLGERKPIRYMPLDW
jgi:hypothetical protein